MTTPIIDLPPLGVPRFWSNAEIEKNRVRFANARTKAATQFSKLGAGSNRITYTYEPGWVLKLPLHYRAELDNRTEAALYQLNPDIYAKCELVIFEEVVALKMEALTIPAWDTWYVMGEHGYKVVNKALLPTWALELYDGLQIGYRATGELVAYDYAFEPYHPQIKELLDAHDPALASWWKFHY